MVAKVNAELGLDKPLPVQYFRFLGDVARGEFGNSLLTKRPVLTEVRERLGTTFELTTFAIVLVLLIGLPVGILSAVRQNSMVDNAARTVAVAGVAIPSFILAMSLQILFYGALGWLPLQGRIDPSVAIDTPIEPMTGLYLVDSLLGRNWEAFLSAAAHIILPLATLTILLLSTVTRITRNMMVEVLKEEYIRTAFAYGLPKRAIYNRYALKATLIPILTVVGLSYGQLLGGAVVVEYVFDWPGLGSFLVSSIAQNDYPASIGATLFLAGIYLLVNLIVDVLYAVVDPRLRTA
ncbi:D,D-dipeptide transport system permease protein DdpB (plasmid) [Sinorhizobium americanum CCGM7]|nr:D,D-dipeptide transport system permease protein DdpB [Sinorhizobium americanum CCGM7]